MDGDSTAKWKALAPWEGKPATVFPLGDFREHAPDDPQCWCNPTYDDGVLVHNAMDQREKYETGEMRRA